MEDIFTPSKAKAPVVFQSENSRYLRIPYLIWGAKSRRPFQISCSVEL